MSHTSWSLPTNRSLPIILIRGFGGLDISEERKNTYQGFNDGTVYPQKQGENYIYEGLLLRFMKSDWEYQDATNVVGYYGKILANEPPMPAKLERSQDQDLREKFRRLKELGYFSHHKVVIDPGMALHLLEAVKDAPDRLWRSLWVFRYYDLNDRKFKTYGQALVRLIDFIRELGAQTQDEKPKVNIIAHSMGGLLVREAIQRTYPDRKEEWEKNGKQGKEPEMADDCINKIVTLGTPHQGITFQILRDWIKISAEDEIEHFNPQFQEDANNSESFVNFHRFFPLERLLTVVGTNYRAYNIAPASWANRLFSVEGEYGSNYNRSDGLVKQTSAQIPGAPRTFVNKCHGGLDSLITARESFEVATRFFFGNVRARLRLVKGKVTRGKDFFGKSELFLGVCIKPRNVDFELFHQSKEAENCYGPFSEVDLSDTDIAFSWAGDNKLIWEGYLNTIPILQDKSITTKDLVLRLDFYVGERDLFGFGFSDNVIFYKQYYIRTLLPTEEQPNPTFYLHTHERFSVPGFQPAAEDKPMQKVNGGWKFDVRGTGFEGTFRIEVDTVPKEGQPVPL